MKKPKLTEQEKKWRAESDAHSLLEAQKISNSINKCKTLSYSYILLKNDETGKFESLADRVLRVLQESWKSIDIEWEQIDTGFKIVKTLLV